MHAGDSWPAPSPSRECPLPHSPTLFLPHWPGLHDIRCIKRMFWMFLMAAEIALNTQANPNATATTTTTIADRKYLRELQSNFPRFACNNKSTSCARQIFRGTFIKSQAQSEWQQIFFRSAFCSFRFIHFVLVLVWFGLVWSSTRGTVSSPIRVSHSMLNASGRPSCRGRRCRRKERHKRRWCRLQHREKHRRR